MGPPWATGPVCVPLHGFHLLPGDCSSVGSAWAAAFFRTHPSTLRAAGTQPSSPWSCQRKQRNFCSGGWNISSLSLLDLGAAGLFHLTHSFLTAAAQCFLPSLKHVSQQCYQQWAQLWPAVGPFKGWLELSLSNMGAAPGPFSQNSTR